MTSGNTAAPPPATWAWAAVVVAIVDALAIAVAGLVSALDGISAPLIEDTAVINVVAGPTFPLLAALMLRQREPGRSDRSDRLAGLFLGLGVLSTATLVVFTYAAHGLRDHGPLTSAAVWVEGWLWTGVAPGVCLLLLWFPTGAVSGRWWRWAEGAAVASAAFMWAGEAFHPGPAADFDPPVDNPLGWPAAQPVLGPVGDAGHLLVAVAFLAAVASLGGRYLHGGDRVRAQLRWLLLAVALLVATATVPAPGSLRVVVVALGVLATALLPVTLAVALTRGGYTLPRVLVYGLVSTLLLTAYVTVVGVVDAISGGRADRAAAVAAAAVVAVLVAPLRARLQRGVDRLVYGDRGDPYAALSDFGRRVSGSPDDLLDEVVRTVARALRSPYVAVALAGETTPTAALGTPTGADVVLPLSLRGEAVGRLVVAQRDRREPFGRRDVALLEELARHVSVAAHASALTRDLQRSRESLVMTREEERRRIRRDLHDGLGPALAGVAFGLDAARNTLRRDPASADQGLARLKAEVQASIADVRRLVYDLRPPALDQLGLVAAIGEYAARLTERAALEITVSAPPMPTLPAAVEVAVYRIATEALTNTVRHSRGRRATVELTLGPDALRLAVTDDGVGPPSSPAGSGVGLAAMRERAAELGGTCSVDAGPFGGARVIAALPVRWAP